MMPMHDGGELLVGVLDELEPLLRGHPRRLGRVPFPLGGVSRGRHRLLRGLAQGLEQTFEVVARGDDAQHHVPDHLRRDLPLLHQVLIGTSRDGCGARSRSA